LNLKEEAPKIKIGISINVVDFVFLIVSSKVDRTDKSLNTVWLRRRHTGKSTN